jgi:hypothetical protein
VKPYRFDRHADADFTAASLHYAAVSTELGQRFYRHVHGLLAEVCAAPLRFRAFMPPARRHFRLPFPYAVVYIDKPDHVWVIGISPFKRSPGYWRERMD